jgi:hypothetical protein
MMVHFYVLKPEEGIRFGTKWAYAEQIDPVLHSEGKKCPVCGGPVSGRRWLPPHRIKLSSAKPKKWGDFLWGAGFLLMVSDRFKKIYKAEELTGITMFYPPTEIVRVGRRRTGDLPPSLPLYHLIEIEWNGANQDDAASGVVHEHPEKIRCTYCRMGVSGRKQSGIVMEKDSWTGADIFAPRGAKVQIMVSERFRQVVETCGLKNTWFIPAKKYAYNEHRPGLWHVREVE